jgi:hypothetical protein
MDQVQEELKKLDQHVKGVGEFVRELDRLSILRQALGEFVPDTVGAQPSESERLRKAALKDLFQKAKNEGLGLRSSDKSAWSRNRDAVEEWRQRTHNLIEAAYGITEAERFDLPGELVPSVEKHLSVLDEIMAQVDYKEINPSFDPQKWKGRFNLE